MIHLRAATADDVSAVREMLGEASLVLDGLEGLADGLLVARDGDRLVGAVGMERHGSHGLLRSLVVDPSRRGTGLGRELTAAAESWAAGHGLATVWLLTETAEPFFAARGYARVDRTTAPAEIAASHEFAHACPASAAFMRKDLS